LGVSEAILTGPAYVAAARFMVFCSFVDFDVFLWHACVFLMCFDSKHVFSYCMFYNKNITHFANILGCVVSLTILG